MILRLLTLVMSTFLMLSVCTPLSADWYNDNSGCGDALVWDKDLLRARAEVFLDPDHPDESPWIYLCYEMCEGSTIPGVVMWEFDADNNPATGSTISTDPPRPPCPCKECKGIDITIIKAYRECSTNQFTAQDTNSIYEIIYGKSMSTLENEWIAYLMSEPPEHFAAPVYIY